MKYWLVNRDPYFMVYEIIPQKINWVPFFFIPEKTTLKQPGGPSVHWLGLRSVLLGTLQEDFNLRPRQFRGDRRPGS